MWGEGYPSELDCKSVFSVPTLKILPLHHWEQLTVLSQQEANLTSDYLFNSNWWSLDKKLKKDIAFVLQHSQRVQQLSAYKLYDMNMTSWMKVLKLAFSLFTVLNRVLK
uniref:Uncharacterized protein LOC114344558 n=1 Tax=Diabrotica virgifera virgifera TaxID=50390 RepID=A0A6P7GMR0_DIAVI